jgi:hypothetical protein
MSGAVSLKNTMNQKKSKMMRRIATEEKVSYRGLKKLWGATTRPTKNQIALRLVRVPADYQNPQAQPQP